ncbi:MAG: glycosyltransferase, partial [Candidatus Hydrogenedentes bacterium]|nr:glycosyltransferase [Candidatus Hydrogenedentota bacterium]
MKIVFFGNASEKIAAIRYRVLKFADMLAAEGHICIVCLPSSISLQERLYEGRSKASKLLFLFLVFLRRLLQLRHVLGADAVLFRGPLFPYGPPVLERLIRLMNPRLIFDIDDAIWEPPAFVDSFFARFIDYGWVRKMAGMCAHAIVGNEYLRQYVQGFNPNITIIPTCIDMVRHVPKEYDAASDGPTVLGWTGLKDNLGYMTPLEPVLQDLAKKYPVRLLISTGRPYTLEGVEVENHYWVLEHEIDYLRQSDIGLMPLEDTPRARGKCAFKALQYMAVGVPPVISPVGMNADVIEHG